MTNAPERPKTPAESAAESAAARTSSPPAARRALAEAAARRAAAQAVAESKEIGGRDGLNPARYGDWEKNGVAVDF